MARRSRRNFKSARTDARKRPKYPVQRKRRSRATTLKYKEGRELAIAKKVASSSERRENKVTASLRVPNRCQTLLNGKLVWASAKDKAGNKIKRNGKIVRFPAIVNATDPDKPTERCEEPAVVSKRKDGKTVHKCAKHVGVWYVDVDGKRHNSDNEIMPTPA
jgi:hypothetical protein